MKGAFPGSKGRALARLRDGEPSGESCLPVSVENSPVFLLNIKGTYRISDLLLTRHGISAAGKAALGNSVKYFHDTVTWC